MLRAVLFDLGDTLLDFEPMDTRALFREAAKVTYDRLAGLGAALPAFERYVGAHFRAVRWSYFWAKLTGREFNSFELLRRFHRRLGLPDGEDLLRELAWDWYAPVVSHTRTEEGLRETLAGLAGAGLALGVVSNTFVPGFVHDRHLELAGLLDLLTVRVYSSEVGHRKPDRRIFRAACERLGVLPGEALFVGDLVKTDIIGAKRFGMRTALKQPWSNPRPHRLADYVVKRIADLVGVVEGLRCGRAGANQAQSAERARMIES